MPKLERTVERRTYHVPPLKRASWGAIFGGLFITIGTMIVLGVLGVAVGASTIDPMGESPSARALGLGAMIWWLASGVISLFIGGWATGRLAGLRRRGEGTLHGLVTWGLYTAIAVLLATSVVGSLMSGAVRVLQTGTVVAARGAEAAVSGMAPRAEEQLSATWDLVWNEAQQILRETEAAALRPEELEGAAREAARQAREADLRGALSTLYESAREGASAADKEAAVNVLTARTGMSQTEAEETVDRWAQAFEETWQGVRETEEAIREARREAAKAAAQAVATAAWWTFVYFLLTAIAAGVGGRLGSPRTRAPLTPPSEVSEARVTTTAEPETLPPPAESRET